MGLGLGGGGTSSVSNVARGNILRHAFHCGQFHPMERRRVQQVSSNNGGPTAMIGIAGNNLLPL